MLATSYVSEVYCAGTVYYDSLWRNSSVSLRFTGKKTRELNPSKFSITLIKQFMFFFPYAQKERFPKLRIWKP